MELRSHVPLVSLTDIAERTLKWSGDRAFSLLTLTHIPPCDPGARQPGGEEEMIAPNIRRVRKGRNFGRRNGRPDNPPYLGLYGQKVTFKPNSMIIHMLEQVTQFAGLLIF
jgi:hypothetical protein